MTSGFFSESMKRLCLENKSACFGNMDDNLICGTRWSDLLLSFGFDLMVVSRSIRSVLGLVVRCML